MPLAISLGSYGSKYKAASPRASFIGDIFEATTGTPSDINATAPGQLRVIRRNGSVTPFDSGKIAVAMTKAFLAVEGGTAAGSQRIHDLVTSLTQEINQAFQRRWPGGGTIHIEAIQDQVELVLMRAGEQKVARAYVLYREERRKQRAEEGGDRVAIAGVK